MRWEKGPSTTATPALRRRLRLLGARSLKPGGVLALVLPLSAASGTGVAGIPQMVATGTRELTVLSIAANGREMSFSSDTGMGECRHCPQAQRRTSSGAQRAHFVSLRSRRPQGFAQAELTGEWASTTATGFHGQYRGRPIRRHEPASGRRRVWRNADRTSLSKDGGELGGRSPSRLLAGADGPRALATPEFWLPGPRRASLPLKTAPLGTGGQTRHGSTATSSGPAPRGPFSKVTSQPDGYVSCTMEPRCQERDSDGLRTGLTATGPAGDGGESCPCVGYCQPCSPEP